MAENGGIVITQINPLTHEKMEGVQIFPIGECVQGKPQEAIVEMKPFAVISAHSHHVDAEMYIAAGSGTVISANPQFNGVEVRVGDRVSFKRDEEHGFMAGVLGLVFITINGGILDPVPGKWDIKFAS